MNIRPAEINRLQALSKVQVRALADEMLSGEKAALEQAVQFVCVETENQWHGRGRAMMCRRMKHAVLSNAQQGNLVGAILWRLTSGRFAEQFRDQLRLALQLDANATVLVAQREAQNTKPHVRRFTAWLLKLHEARMATKSSTEKTCAGKLGLASHINP